jgi:predicted small metal-binding protein
MCGYQARGTDEEIVRAIQDHAERAHGRRPSRDEILGLAVELGSSADDV